MGFTLRSLLGLVLLGILLFCLYGFLATFEPLAPSVRLTWRIVYGITAVACIGGLIALWRRRGGK